MFCFKEYYAVQDLIAIVAELRDAQSGCPWDLAQTHESIRQNFIEETYEAVSAIDEKDAEHLREELGDVLLQVALHAQMEQEAAHFDFDGVCDGICKKLILRHPHIFADTHVSSAEQVLKSWDEIKQREKGQKNGTDTVLDVPAALPALMRSQKVQKRAGKAGLDFKDLQATIESLEMEIQELKQAIESQHGIQDELGDVLFSAVNVARFVKVDAEEALSFSCAKFVKRFVAVEHLAEEQGLCLTQMKESELNELWQQVKRDPAEMAL